MDRTWPTDWNARVLGHGCAMCDDVGGDDKPNGIRFFAGQCSDAYLGRRGPARGYAYVIWRGRHVAEPTELTQIEACEYWGEVLRAARAIERLFTPCKMNYQLLGNGVPHLHAHLIPRYLDDIAPNMPLPSAAWAQGERNPFLEAQVRADADSLRALIDAD